MTARLGLLRSMAGLRLIDTGPPIHIGCQQCPWDGRFRNQEEALDAFLQHWNRSHLGRPMLDAFGHGCEAT